MSNRLSEYRVMWLLVLFDLPTETKKDIREYTLFRKRLIKDGFTMFQFSIYIRHCASMENAEVHRKRLSLSYPNLEKLVFFVLPISNLGTSNCFSATNLNSQTRLANN